MYARLMRRFVLLAALAVPIAFTFNESTAAAGPIADENAKAGFGSWPVSRDGTANGAGVVDVYPAEWSITQGTTLRLKVRSTTGYSIRILRLGWYGGSRSRQIAYSTGFSADPQPYPTSDATYGMAEARWHDSATFSTSGWPQGFYVARVERSDGNMAETPFVVRDDGLTRMPILVVLSTTTHQAYNAWPGAKRGGKSLYGFNSSSTTPTQANSGMTQAVKVSFDRPFLVGGGTADLGNYEYPMAAFLEKNGWDVAYAMDQDLHTNPDLVKNRKAVIVVGHAEYYTRAMFDALLAARDNRVNFLFSTGDTLSWQVRFESGAGGSNSTVVGYKENYVKDPEQKLGYSLESQGKYAEAASHYRYVTRGWKSLKYNPDHGIDERRPGIIMTGVMSSGMIRDASGNGTWYPWADLRITNSTHWIFKGAGVSYGTRIPNIMGYEVDSTQASTTWLDPFRPPNVVRLGQILQDSDGTQKGSAAAYHVDFSDGTRSEVVSMGAIAFSWGLDDFAQSGSSSPIAQTMLTNALKRWTGLSPAADHDDGHDEDPSAEPVLSPNEDDPSDSQAQATGGGCTISRTATASDAMLPLAAVAALALATARRRRRRRV